MSKSQQKLSELSGEITPWWKRWGKTQEWQDNLQRRAAHKALDIPDEMGIQTTTNTGIGALGATGIALAAGLPTAGLAALMFLKGMDGMKPEAPVEPPPAQKPAEPTPGQDTVLGATSRVIGADGEVMEEKTLIKPPQ